MKIEKSSAPFLADDFFGILSEEALNLLKNIASAWFTSLHQLNNAIWNKGRCDSILAFEVKM